MAVYCLPHVLVAITTLFLSNASAAGNSLKGTVGQSVALKALDLAAHSSRAESFSALVSLAKKVGLSSEDVWGHTGNRTDDINLLSESDIDRAFNAALSENPDFSGNVDHTASLVSQKIEVESSSFGATEGGAEVKPSQSVGPDSLQQEVNGMLDGMDLSEQEGSNVDSKSLISQGDLGRTTGPLPTDRTGVLGHHIQSIARTLQHKDSDKFSISSSDMEKAITHLVTGGKSGSAATPMSGSVQKIKDMIEKVMMPAVLDAHKADQKELNKLIQDIRECENAKDIGFRLVLREKKKYITSSALHKACRADEAVKFTAKKACFLEEAQKKRIKMLKCKAFADTSRRVGDGNRNRQIVKRGGSESVSSYVKRISATVCGRPGGGGNGNYGKRGMLDDLLQAQADCVKAMKDYNTQVVKCRRALRDYVSKKKRCNVFQDKMDSASCKRAVHAKDTCETYAECYRSKRDTHVTAKKTVVQEEKDRKAEWRGLKRMACLINAFSDGKVDNKEVDACKNTNHSTTLLDVNYTAVPKFVPCILPVKYPSTPEYKQAEFAPLPSLAKGKTSVECSGVKIISTKPKTGSPQSCKCYRVMLNGPYSAGALVKCMNCWTVRRTTEKNSCPAGTKIFSPASQADWQTFIKSTGPIRDPHFIIDITRPQNSCGGCTTYPMNSGVTQQGSWRTSDGSAWWLRSTRYNEPNGDYHANCYLDLWHTPTDPAAITWNDARCNYHSKSYYCQPKKYSMKPKPGSPSSCSCKQVSLAGPYSAKVLVKCEQCLNVRKSTQKNSCPIGMKLFSPASRDDWKTFLKSAGPLRAPYWIIDVTRPSNGCGGCTRSPMYWGNARQKTWRTTDGSPWWLRSSRYGEPNGDYHANCFLDLWHNPPNENAVTFNDWNCKYNSRSYYCQPVKKKR